MQEIPDMILQFAHHIKNLVIKNAGFHPEILQLKSRSESMEENIKFFKIEFIIIILIFPNFSPALNWVIIWINKK